MTTVPDPPFQDRDKRDELRCLEVAVGVQIDPERLDKRPGFPLAAFQDTARRNAFLEVFEWTLAQALEQGVGVDRHAAWKAGLAASVAVRDEPA